VALRADDGDARVEGEGQEEGDEGPGEAPEAAAGGMTVGRAWMLADEEGEAMEEEEEVVATNGAERERGEEGEAATLKPPDSGMSGGTSMVRARSRAGTADEDAAAAAAA